MSNELSGFQEDMTAPSREELRIVRVFMKSLFEEMTVSEVMKSTGKISKPWVFNVLENYHKRGLLKKRRKGNVNLYSANMESPVLTGHFLLLQSILLEKSGQLDTVSKIINSIPSKFYCMAIFGSGAEKMRRTDSDLDICLLVGSDDDGKRIKPYMDEVKLKIKTDIDDHIIKAKDFVGMLLRPEENLGKQIYKKHILAFNGAIFYELLREANMHGFR